MNQSKIVMVTNMQKAMGCSSFISKSINLVKVALRKKHAPSKSLQKSNSDDEDEERYQYTDADAPYTPEEIKKRFWELWIF